MTKKRKPYKKMIVHNMAKPKQEKPMTKSGNSDFSCQAESFLRLTKFKRTEDDRYIPEPL